VIAAALSMAVALLVLATSAPMQVRTRALLAGVAVFAVCGLFVPRASAGPAPAGVSSSTGGFAVRERIWARSLAMLADHPWSGVGPGQFEARFPVYRDPKEIELSTHGRAIDAETEVEHPHEDWIAPALELGSIAGLAWIAFLALVGWRSLAALRAGDPELEPLALGALGILAYALVHAPLTREPAAASIAFVLFGIVLARPKPAPPFIPLAAAGLLFCLAPRAYALVRHGFELADLAHATTDRALEACPDSPLALEIRARALEQAKGTPAAVRAAWEKVLEVRPESFEAHAELGIALARGGELQGARAELAHALALDPGHPGVKKDLERVNLELDLAKGRLEAGRPWLDGADPIPEECYARSRKERAGGDRVLADLFEARAHLLWARQHAALGNFDDAVRSYRQCVRVTRDHVEGGAPRIRLELAAALAAAGRKDEARTELDAIRSASPDRDALPPWATESLRDLE
jgi:tetratricopeptide (TPR) repeat protein